MKGNPLSRLMYMAILVLLTAGALFTAHRYPALHDTDVNTLGFLGFWLTLYGLIVAICEIVRNGSVAHQMARVAEASHNRLKRQMEHHEIQACIEIINSALSDLYNKKAVPVIFITRIKQGYISSFAKAGIPDRYRENLSILNSYEHLVQSRALKTKTNPNYAGSQYPKPNPGTPDNPYRLTIDTLKRMQDDLLIHSASKNEYIGDPA